MSCYLEQISASLLKEKGAGRRGGRFPQTEDVNKRQGRIEAFLIIFTPADVSETANTPNTFKTKVSPAEAQNMSV